MRPLNFLFASLIILGIAFACSHTYGKKEAISEESTFSSPKELSQEFKQYWYAGTAEISSYQLQQARYGELRDGKAVLVFVTEPFSPTQQVKADRQGPEDISVLKLNATKNFNTGIYPYSIMTSSFYPVSDDQHALKVTSSIQEWCGHVYIQLNNKEKFDIRSHSYFQMEGDQDFSIDKAVLENELWQKIRIAPSGLPIGSFTAIPALEFTRFRHLEVKGYKAEGTIEQEGDWSVYTLHYPKVGRTLLIRYRTTFPHDIEGWTERYTSGYGSGAKEMTSTATRIEQIRSPYWSQNSNTDLYLRDSLGL